MRRYYLASLLICGLAPPVLAAGMPSFVRPATEETLRKLDSDQLRIVRRAVQSCPSISVGRGTIRPERNPCVMSSTDKAVADSGDEDLQTFHRALRRTDRYDENRTAAAWMVWFAKD